MTGISCAASDACTAVGSFQTAMIPRSEVVFAEQWDGRRWSLLPLQQIPPGEDKNAITSIACPSPQECVAVGQNGTAPMAEMITPGRWAQQSLPAPPAASVLSSVACRSSSSCLAVGYSTDGSPPYSPLIESWDGSAWSIVTAPTALAAATPTAVTCNTTQCTILGDTADQIIAETQQGAGWSESTITPPAGWPRVQASSLACPTVSECELAGSLTGTTTTAQGTTYGGEPLLENWNGLIWTQQAPPPQPNRATQPSSLMSISCPNPTTCVAAGSTGPFGQRPLIERFTGDSDATRPQTMWQAPALSHTAEDVA
jgi:hypothetical protein